MNKQTYEEMFEDAKTNKNGVFIPFIVAGDPDYETSLEIGKNLVDNGADALEIGFPYTDPVADGQTVQNADLRAFKAGMDIEKCFKFLKDLRDYTSKPFGLLLYYNLIYKYGINLFYKKLQEIGVNAVLVADLPPEEAGDALAAANKYGIKQIFIVAQSTNDERLKQITKIVGGFIYIASIMGTTGARNKVEHNTTEMIKRIREHTNIPLCVGFGISKPEHVKKVLISGSDGAIVGSALINIIANNLNDKNKMLNEIKEYTIKMKDATRGIK